MSLKVKTLLDLQNEMDAEFAWRKKELHLLRAFVEKSQASASRDLALRSGVAILYSHWEGFIKAIGTAYVEFVASQRLLHCELAGNFLAMVVGTVVHGASSSQKIQSKLDIVEFFRSKQESRSRLLWRGKIKTKSNLNSEVLKDVVLSLGLDYGPYATKEKLIDAMLLGNRNKIAHGQFLIVDDEEYFLLHSEILGLMQVFYSQIETAAGNGRFRLPVANPAALPLQ